MAPSPPTDTRFDAELVARLSAGDDRALGKLYDRHAALVFTLARAVVGSDADAEEVTEDVFIQVWTRPDQYDAGRGEVRSWLATIARTRALDHIRSRQRRAAAHERSAARDPDGLAAGPSAAPPADTHALQGEVRAWLDRALGVLNGDQRRAIELAYLEGLSQSEIARRLDEPLGTVKTRIRDGMARLRDTFARPEEATP